MTATSAPSPIYQGQFGEFTITANDRRGVIVYRMGLVIAALSFAIATGLALTLPNFPFTPWVLTGLYAVFGLALGVSLLTIHIYLIILHRFLQACWLIGAIASVVIAVKFETPLVVTVYEQPFLLLGVGWLFVALTGIFFKEAFCFDRLETKLLTPLVPMVLLGHMSGLLPLYAGQLLLVIWAGGFLIFAGRKAFQAIPDDIGDKSVFEYLHQQSKPQSSKTA
ncbi:DUF2301 domain-containing membrane protein [Trichothermofontia sp.]